MLNDFASAAWRDRYLRPAQWGVCGSCRQLGPGNFCCVEHQRAAQKPLGPIGDEPDYEDIAERRDARRVA